MKHYASILLPVAAALLWAAPGAAQTAIRAGQTVSGTLSTSDPTLEDDSHYDLFSYRGTPGEQVVVTMRSSAFDAILTAGTLSGGDLDVEASDDDGAGGTDARMEATVPASGTLVIRANSISAAETGAYTLQVERAGGPAPVAGGGGRGGGGRPTEIRAGQTVRGELASSDPVLEDDSHYDLYAYRGSAGERVTVTLRSTDFDALLAAGTLAGNDLTVEALDDDGAGGSDARMEATVPASGTLVIRANSLTGGETGAYTLQVERGATPISGGGNRGGGGGRGAQGTAIRAGQTVQGQLSASDPKLGDDSHYDLYTYQGAPGEEIEITLQSSDFDAYLGGGGTPDAALSGGDTDDDGAGGTNSRLRVSVGSNGQYVIRANSLRGGATGGYTLAVRSAGSGGRNAGGGATNFPTVRVGQTVSGRLEASDPTLNDGSHFDVYTYAGNPGDEIVVTLSSTDFDPYMTLARMFGGELEEVSRDDDSGPGNNAQVRARLDGSGTYVIVANSFAADETGSYTVTVQRGSDVATGEARGAAAGMVAVQAGQPVRGRLERNDRMLSDSSFADMYVYRGSPGERIQITLRSTDFDAYLSVGTTDGEDLETIDQDDDGAGGNDAQVVVAVDQAGLYAIQANSYAAGQTGNYTLTVERVAAVEESGRGQRAGASNLQGKWLAGYPAVQSPQFRTLRDQMQSAGRMESVIAQLADFPLPRNVPLQFGECGFVNAFYSPAEGSVTFCYEMFPYLNQVLGGQAQGSDLAEAVNGAFLFIMMHEVGHALVHQLDLPITGKEEDAADQLAALVLLRDGDKGASAAIAGVAALQSGDNDFDDSDFADEHSLGPQRLFSVICLIYGSDPDKYQGWVTNGLLPEARAVRCPAEYAQISKSWTRLLGEHYGN